MPQSSHTIPNHKKLDRDVLRAIIRQMGLTIRCAGLTSDSDQLANGDLFNNDHRRFVVERCDLNLVDRSFLSGNLILLEFAVWHLVGPGAQGFLRKFDAINPKCHASAQPLPDLIKLLGRS